MPFHFDAKEMLSSCDVHNLKRKEWELPNGVDGDDDDGDDDGEVELDEENTHAHWAKVREKERQNEANEVHFQLDSVRNVWVD